MEKSIIVTNNPAVWEKFKKNHTVKFLEGKTYPEVLERVRNDIHKGHTLLTHPLSGSVKPNETPYKSIMISEKREELDERGLLLVEDAISTVKKFLQNAATPVWNDKILDDFQAIDLSIIENVIEKLNH